jgi:hypothetical protein
MDSNVAVVVMIWLLHLMLFCRCLACCVRFLCCHSVVFDGRHHDRCDGSFVRTIELHDNVLIVCENGTTHGD